MAATPPSPDPGSLIRNAIIWRLGVARPPMPDYTAIQGLEEVVTYNEVDGTAHNHLTIDWFDINRTTTSKKILKWLE